MVTITINERTKAGKMLLELANLLAKSNTGVSIGNTGLNKPAGYNPKFVDKIKKAEKQKGKKFNSAADLWESIK